MKKLLLLLIILFILPSDSYAEIDLSSMSAKELSDLISQAGSALSALVPTDDSYLLYDNEGLIVSINSTKIDTSNGTLTIMLRVINDTDRQVTVRFSDVYINGWAVNDVPDNNRIQPNMKSKNVAIYLRNVFDAAGITSFDEIESIAADFRFWFDTGYDGHIINHCIMSYTEDKGVQVITRESDGSE